MFWVVNNLFAGLLDGREGHLEVGEEKKCELFSGFYTRALRDWGGDNVV